MNTVKPMLARKYDGRELKNHYVSYKLDGIRCVAVVTNGKAKLFTREGKEIDMPHVVRDVEFMCSGKSIVLDGELYSHALSFETIQSAFASGDRFCQLQYHVYDVVDDNKVFSERSEFINSIPELQFVKPLLSHKVADKSELMSMYTDALSQGFEGVIVRNDVKYKHNRTVHMMKVKKTDDDEFRFVRVDYGETGKKVAVFVTSAGEEFKATIEGEQNYLPSVGDYYNVRFMEMTERGIPRHAVTSFTKKIDRTPGRQNFGKKEAGPETSSITVDEKKILLVWFIICVLKAIWTFFSVLLFNKKVVNGGTTINKHYHNEESEN